MGGRFDPLAVVIDAGEGVNGADYGVSCGIHKIGPFDNMAER